MQLSLSHVKTEAQQVHRELEQLLGEQAWMLGKQIDLVDVIRIGPMDTT